MHIFKRNWGLFSLWVFLIFVACFGPSRSSADEQCLNDVELPGKGPASSGKSVFYLNNREYKISCVVKNGNSYVVRVTDPKTKKIRDLTAGELKKGEVVYEMEVVEMKQMGCYDEGKLSDGRTLSSYSKGNGSYLRDGGEKYWVTCIQRDNDGAVTKIEAKATGADGTAKTLTLSAKDLSNRMIFTKDSEGNFTTQQNAAIKGESFRGNKGTPVECKEFKGNNYGQTDNLCDGDVPAKTDEPTLCEYDRPDGAPAKANEQLVATYGKNAGQYKVTVLTIPRTRTKDPNSNRMITSRVDWVNFLSDKRTGRIIGYEIHELDKASGRTLKKAVFDPRLDLDAWRKSGALSRHRLTPDLQAEAETWDDELNGLLGVGNASSCPFAKNQREIIAAWQDPRDEIADYFFNGSCSDSFAADRQFCCDDEIGQVVLKPVGSCPDPVFGENHQARNTLRIMKKAADKLTGTDPAEKGNADFNRSMINTTRRALLVQQIAIMGQMGPNAGGPDLQLGLSDGVWTDCGDFEKTYRQEVKDARAAMASPAMVALRKKNEAQTTKQLMMDTIQMAFENCRKRGLPTASDRVSQGTIDAISARNPVIHALGYEKAADYFDDFYEAFNKNVPGFEFDTKYIVGTEATAGQPFWEWCEFSRAEKDPQAVRDSMLKAVAKLDESNPIFSNPAVTSVARQMRKTAFGLVGAKIWDFTNKCSEADEWFEKNFWTSDDGLSLWRNKTLVRNTVKEYVARGGTLDGLAPLKAAYCRNQKALEKGEERASYWRKGIDIAGDVALHITPVGAALGQTVRFASIGLRMAQAGVAIGLASSAASTYSDIVRANQAYSNREEANNLLFAGVGSIADADQAAREYSEAMTSAIMNTAMFLTMDAGDVLAYARALKMSKKSWESVVHDLPETSAHIARFKKFATDGHLDGEILTHYLQLIERQCPLPVVASCIVTKLELLNREIEEYVAWKATKTAKDDASFIAYLREKEAKAAKLRLEEPQPQSNPGTTLVGHSGEEPITVKSHTEVVPDSEFVVETRATKSQLSPSHHEEVRLKKVAPSGPGNAAEIHAATDNYEKAVKKYNDSLKDFSNETELAEATSHYLTANGIPHNVVLSGNKHDAQLVFELGGDFTEAEIAAMGKTKLGRRLLLEKKKHPGYKILASPGLLEQNGANALHYPADGLIVVSNRSTKNLDLTDFGYTHESGHRATANKVRRRDLEKEDHLELHGRLSTTAGSLPVVNHKDELPKSIYDANFGLDEVARNGEDIRNYSGLMAYRIENWGKAVPPTKALKDWNFDQLLFHAQHSATTTIGLTERVIATSDLYLKNGKNVRFDNLGPRKGMGDTLYVTGILETPQGKVFFDKPLMKLNPNAKHWKLTDDEIRMSFFEQLRLDKEAAENWNKVARRSNEILGQIAKSDLKTAEGLEKASQLAGALKDVNKKELTLYPTKTGYKGRVMDRDLDDLYSKHMNAKPPVATSNVGTVKEGKARPEAPGHGGPPRGGPPPVEPPVHAPTGPVGATTKQLQEIGNDIPRPLHSGLSKEDVYKKHGLGTEAAREDRKLPAKPGNVQENYHSEGKNGAPEVTKIADSTEKNRLKPEDKPLLEWRQLILTRYYEKQKLPVAYMYGSREEIADGVVHQQYIEGRDHNFVLKETGHIDQKTRKPYIPDAHEAPDYHRFLDQYKRNEHEIAEFFEKNGIPISQEFNGKKIRIGADIKPDNFIYNEVLDGSPFDPRSMFKLRDKKTGEDRVFRAVLIDP